MKKIHLLILTCIVSVLTSSVHCQTLCKAEQQVNQENDEDLSFFQSGYYIIAGVFNIRENAVSFSRQLRTKGFSPSVFHSSSSGKTYVCIENSNSFEKLRKKLLHIKKTEALKDVWILKISGQKEKKKKRTSESGIGAHRKNKSARNLAKTHYKYKVYIHVHDKKNEPIPAKVAIIDGEKAKVISSISSNELVCINHPRAGSQTVKLSCEVFGFHKTTLDLNLYDPVNAKTYGRVKKSGDTIFVDMMLEKPKKGDIMVMYNVFFFPNSNAIRHSSNYELQQLLNLLKENPELKIKIHGHTNGKSFGKFQAIKKDSPDLFSISDHSVKYGNSGSLSRLRALTIKKFLIQNNIDENRIKIKGWGGRKMIHKEHSPLAEYNIRVEIEVLEN